MANNEFKSKIISRCQEMLQGRISTLVQDLEFLVADIAEDTKSSAGDKYETGREMANMERQKLSDQLAFNKKSLGMLNNLPTEVENEIQAGALIKTASLYIFIAVSLGQIELEDTKILVISPNAPLAQALLGVKTGDVVNFNQQQYRILSIS